MNQVPAAVIITLRDDIAVGQLRRSGVGNDANVIGRVETLQNIHFTLLLRGDLNQCGIRGCQKIAVNHRGIDDE